MKKEYICDLCGEIFTNRNIKANHVRWKHNTKDKNAYIQKLQQSVNKHYDIKYGKLTTYYVMCSNYPKCDCIVEIQEREFTFPQKNNYFCSRKCSNTKSVTEESKLKRSLTIRTKLYPTRSKEQHLNDYYNRYCALTSIQKKDRKQRRKLNKRKEFLNSLDVTKKKEYYKACKFTFSLNLFPDEFDFELIKKLGWYQAKNKNYNPNGVNRDHIFSIAEGYKQQIPPYYIRHPANCQLVSHTYNIKKRAKCDITINNLITKILKWNYKYGEYI